MKIKAKFHAIKLRQQGKSYAEILKIIPVSKGTLSRWLCDIPLTQKQKEYLYVTRRQQNAYRLAKLRREQRRQREQIIVESAKKEVRERMADPLFLSGLMLYWAEGDKTEMAQEVKFSNSDPRMIVLMMRWFREVCHVPKEKFHIALHIHELHNQKNVERYWSRISGLPITQFYKTWIKPTSLGQRRRILYNGTCSIRILDISLLRRIHGWKLGVLEMLLPHGSTYEIILSPIKQPLVA